MSDNANGYAAKTSSNKLELIEYKLKNFEPNEVEIEIDHCGVCGTDVSYINNKFGITNYPFIGGHEILWKRQKQKHTKMQKKSILKANNIEVI